jgi:hypothetical protein
MHHHLPPQTPDAVPVVTFSTLLYRFLFFDWLFRDMSKASTIIERHSVWQHNRKMRKYLPVYLWRWMVIAAIDFALGCLFEQLLQTGFVAAWFFTWSCITVTGMGVIVLMWIFLGKADWA